MNVSELLASFTNKRVLVIGDSIVDVNTYLEPIKPLDDGTPVYRKIAEPDRGHTDIYSVGGAALVVRNLLELRAKVDFVSAFGYGSTSQHVSMISHVNLTKHFIHVGREQTTKHRFWCDGVKVMQVDTLCSRPTFPPDADAALIEYAHALAAKPDVVVVADYRHGLITEQMAKEIVRMARASDVTIYVSSQVAQSKSNHRWYDSEQTVFVLNEPEAALFKPPFRTIRTYVTQGAGGAVEIQHGHEISGWREYVSALLVKSVDSCGAGDAFLAAISVSGSLEFANTWAGLSCTVKGANPPTQAMILKWSDRHEA